MQASEVRASLSEYQPLAESVRGQLVYSFQKSALEMGLSRDVIDRYLAWTFVFTSWCYEMPPHRIGPDRIDEFRRELERCGDVETDEIHRAMDGLAFLFGAVDGAQEILSSVGSPDGECTASTSGHHGSQPEPDEAPTGDDAIRTLQIGWKQGADRSTDSIQTAQHRPAGVSGSVQAGDPASGPASEDSAASSEPAAQPPSSTAEICIDRFQTQVDSLHEDDPDST